MCILDRGNTSESIEYTLWAQILGSTNLWIVVFFGLFHQIGTSALWRNFAPQLLPVEDSVQHASDQNCQRVMKLVPLSDKM